jgi:hypothetical protein
MFDQPGKGSSSESTQVFLLIGTLFLLRIILMYTGWFYWRSAVRCALISAITRRFCQDCLGFRFGKPETWMSRSTRGTYWLNARGRSQQMTRFESRARTPAYRRVTLSFAAALEAMRAPLRSRRIASDRVI